MAAGELLETGSVWTKTGDEVGLPFVGQCLDCVLSKKTQQQRKESLKPSYCH